MPLDYLPMAEIDIIWTKIVFERFFSFWHPVFDQTEWGTIMVRMSLSLTKASSITENRKLNHSSDIKYVGISCKRSQWISVQNTPVHFLLREVGAAKGPQLQGRVDSDLLYPQTQGRPLYVSFHCCCFLFVCFSYFVSFTFYMHCFLRLAHKL